MSVEECQRQLTEKFAQIGTVLTRFIDSQMLGMTPQHMIAFKNEVERSADETAIHLEEQHKTLTFWLHRILTAKETSKPDGK